MKIKKYLFSVYFASKNELKLSITSNLAERRKLTNARPKLINATSFINLYVIIID